MQQCIPAPSCSARRRSTLRASATKKGSRSSLYNRRVPKNAGKLRFHASAWAPPIAAGLAITACVTIALSAFGSDPWGAGLAAVVFALASSIPIVLVWLAAAWGLGAYAEFLWRSCEDPAARRLFRFAFGSGTLLAIAHLMGVLGLVRTGAVGALIAWIPIAVGLALAIRDLRRPRDQPTPILRYETQTWLPVVSAVPIAALLVALTAPPGMLWSSEARGFDVLSYHLQLPREWLAQGRIEPLHHNSYSWLPSAMESAYLHLGALLAWNGQDPFTAGEGVATIASNALHAALTIASAIALSLLVRVIIEREARDDRHASRAPALAFVLLLTIPWVIVTGSLAYNEGAVLLFGCAAMLACEAPGLTAARRGMLAGVFVGIACTAKPTALFMIGAPVGLLLLTRTPGRHWLRAVIPGAILGLLVITPWLARNAWYSGNPVFPYLSSLFGTGHWTTLEADRWTLGHHAETSIIRRAAMLVAERGFAHQQWGPLPGLAAFAAVGLLLFPAARRAAAPYSLILALQLTLWIFIGHQQSRFLLPAAPIIVLLIALTARRIEAASPRVGAAIAWVLAAALAVLPPAVLVRDASGKPSRPALVGVGVLTGEALREPIARANPDERERTLELLAPTPWINLTQHARITRLYLLGDSTPFYMQVPLLWHTTWEASPLGAALRAHQGDLAKAVRALAAPPPAGHGVSHILINRDELARLRRDRWYDPDVTPDIVDAIIRTHARTIRAFSPDNSPSRGSILIELIPEPQ